MGKITRKISLLIALCMIVTVGGVYAQWVYTDVDTGVVVKTTHSEAPNMQVPVLNFETPQNGHFELIHEDLALLVTDDIIAETDASGSVITDSNSVTVVSTTVASAQQGDFIPELSYTGNVVFKYTHYVNYDNNEDVPPATLNLVHTVAETADIKYNDERVFMFFEDEDKEHSITGHLIVANPTDGGEAAAYSVLKINEKYGADTVTDNDIGKYLFVINGESLSHHFTINPDIKLKTINAYYEFANLIASTLFQITISDVLAQ